MWLVGALRMYLLLLPSLWWCLNDSFSQRVCFFPTHSGLWAVASGWFQRPETGPELGGQVTLPGPRTLWARGHWPRWLKAEGTSGHTFLGEPRTADLGTRRRKGCPVCSAGGGFGAVIAVE